MADFVADFSIICVTQVVFALKCIISDFQGKVPNFRLFLAPVLASRDEILAGLGFKR